MENYESNFPAGKEAVIDVLGRDAGCLFHPFDEVGDDDEKRTATEDAISQMHDRGTGEIVHADD